MFEFTGRDLGRWRHAMMAGGGLGGKRGRREARAGRGGRGMAGEGEAFMRGRRFSAEDLQLIVLGLLAEKPSHGYELIKAIAARSKGFYEPSPGVIYPALTYLEELGLTEVETVSNKKRYKLAAAGQVFLEERRERFEELIGSLAHLGRKMEYVRRAMAGEAPPDAEQGDDGSAWLAEFVEARMRLKRALLLRSNASPDEQRQIAAILDRAAEAIRELDASSLRPGSHSGPRF